MDPRIERIALFFALFLLGADQGGRIVRTIVVQTRDVASYRESMDEGVRIMRELGVIPEIRVDPRPIEIGDGLFEVKVVIEYPDRRTREEWASILAEAERFSDWLRALEKLRTVVSDEEREARR